MSCWQKVRVVSVQLFHAAFPGLPNSKLGRLSISYKFIMNNPSNIKKKIQQHCFDSIWNYRIFLVVRNWKSSLCTLSLRFSVVLVDPRFITCDDTAQHVILPLQKVLANCDSSLLLFFGELLWDHFYTHLPYAKIFS